MQLGYAPQWYPSLKGLMEKSKCDTVNYTLLLWERGADLSMLWMLTQGSSVRMPLPQHSTTAKIPDNNGLETTGFVQQFLLFALVYLHPCCCQCFASLPVDRNCWIFRLSSLLTTQKLWLVPDCSSTPQTLLIPQGVLLPNQLC